MMDKFDFEVATRRLAIVDIFLVLFVIMVGTWQMHILVCLQFGSTGADDALTSVFF